MWVSNFAISPINLIVPVENLSQLLPHDRNLLQGNRCIPRKDNDQHHAITKQSVTNFAVNPAHSRHSYSKSYVNDCTNELTWEHSGRTAIGGTCYHHHPSGRGGFVHKKKPSRPTSSSSLWMAFYVRLGLRGVFVRRIPSRFESINESLEFFSPTTRSTAHTHIFYSWIQTVILIWRLKPDNWTVFSLHFTFWNHLSNQ